MNPGDRPRLGPKTRHLLKRLARGENPYEDKMDHYQASAHTRMMEQLFEWDLALVQAINLRFGAVITAKGHAWLEAEALAVMTRPR